MESDLPARGVSVLVYGRNDSHGYNLHKRAAISINTFAEHLNPEFDELIFVDCNSPDDVPTFPEAIADALTPRTKALLRILRLRAADFRRLAIGSGAAILEGLARNVGIRRSSSRSRWILSTTTDIVLCTINGQRFSNMLSSLAPGYYGLPRFDVPQALWEQLERSSPLVCIEAIQRWADRFHLRLIVEVDKPFIRYDNPGDFQLLLRQDLFSVGGFDESMVRGPYHLDSNLAKRLSLIHGQVQSLLQQVEVFHCDHSRQAMVKQSRQSKVANDWYHYVEAVTQPSLLKSQPDWGARGLDVEEIRLGSRSRYEQLLSKLLPIDMAGLASPARLAKDIGLDAKLNDLLPFLADHLLYLPPGTKVAIFSEQSDLVLAITKLLTEWIPNSMLLIPHMAVATLGAQTASLKEISSVANVMIFDPRTQDGSIGRKRIARLTKEIASLQSRRPYARRAKVIFVMAHGTWFRKIATRFYDLFQAPAATWIHHGRAKSASRVFWEKLRMLFWNPTKT